MLTEGFIYLFFLTFVGAKVIFMKHLRPFKRPASFIRLPKYPSPSSRCSRWHEAAIYISVWHRGDFCGELPLTQADRSKTERKLGEKKERKNCSCWLQLGITGWIQRQHEQKGSCFTHRRFAGRTICSRSDRGDGETGGFSTDSDKSRRCRRAVWVLQQRRS